MFNAELPPLGYNTYIVQPAAEAAGSACRLPVPTQLAAGEAAAGMHGARAPASRRRTAAVAKKKGPVTLSGGVVSVTFDAATGLMTGVEAGGIKAALEVGFGWYNSSGAIPPLVWRSAPEAAPSTGRHTSKLPPDQTAQLCRLRALTSPSPRTSACRRA